MTLPPGYTQNYFEKRRSNYLQSSPNGLGSPSPAGIRKNPYAASPMKPTKFPNLWAIFGKPKNHNLPSGYDQPKIYETGGPKIRTATWIDAVVMGLEAPPNPNTGNRKDILDAIDLHDWYVKNGKVDKSPYGINGPPIPSWYVPLKSMTWISQQQANQSKTNMPPAWN